MGLFVKKPNAGKGAPEVVPEKGFGLFVAKPPAAAASEDNGGTLRSRAPQGEVIDVEPVLRSASSAEPAPKEPAPSKAAESVFPGLKIKRKPTPSEKSAEAAVNPDSEQPAAEGRPSAEAVAPSTVQSPGFNAKFSWGSKGAKAKPSASAESAPGAGPVPPKPATKRMPWGLVLATAVGALAVQLGPVRANYESIENSKVLFAAAEQERLRLADLIKDRPARAPKLEKEQGLELANLRKSVEFFWEEGAKVRLEATPQETSYFVSKPFKEVGAKKSGRSKSASTPPAFKVAEKVAEGCTLTPPAVRGELNVIEAKITCTKSGPGSVAR